MPGATLPLVHTTAVRHSVLAEPADVLKSWLVQRGEPAMRARQIRRWVLLGRAETFDQMTDLPKGLRTALAEEFEVFSTRVETHQAAADDTHKLLLKLADDKMIECVLIQDAGRATACVSTQVGCGMGCVFCASGLNGVARNLSAGEIVEQLVRLRNLTPKDGRLTHIVVMGMGEPLANLDNLLAALAVAGDKNGLGIGARHVTISTVGLPVKIRQLASTGKQYHLAVSLHAPNDSLRTEIVPTNDKTGMNAILAAADHFYETTGRRVTYEYVVLGGLNDRPEHGRELASRLRGRQALVNLIPWNEVSGLPYRRPNDGDLNKFMAELESAGVRVKVRKRKGSDIDAACGQLRRTVEAERQETGDRLPMTGQTSEMMAIRDPDVRLMLRVRDTDDQTAFAELVDRYQHRLVGILGHLVRGADGAEDLAQEAFLRIYRTRKQYTPKAKFSTWLFTIANNLALNSLRDRSRRPTVTLDVHDSGPLGARPEEQLATTNEPQPSGALRKIELAKIVRQALDGLNDRQRVAVLLNKFEDMGYVEIAEVMGLTVKAVKSLLSRARGRLREVLQPYIYMDGETPPVHDDDEDE